MLSLMSVSFSFAYMLNLGGRASLFHIFCEYDTKGLKSKQILLKPSANLGNAKGQPFFPSEIMNPWIIIPSIINLIQRQPPA